MNEWKGFWGFGVPRAFEWARVRGLALRARRRAGAHAVARELMSG
jgi:hypothetical protein